MTTEPTADRKAAERLRALEASHKLALSILESIDKFADQFGTPEGRDVLARHDKLYEEWRAAVRAVEEAQ